MHTDQTANAAEASVAKRRIDCFWCGQAMFTCDDRLVCSGCAFVASLATYAALPSISTSTGDHPLPTT